MSNIERAFALWLAARREPFVKPLVADGEGLRVDFVLPRLKTIVELNGRSDDPAYVVRKARQHRRLVESERYAGWRIVVHEAVCDDDFSELENSLYRKRLPRAI